VNEKIKDLNISNRNNEVNDDNTSDDDYYTEIP